MSKQQTGSPSLHVCQTCSAPLRDGRRKTCTACKEAAGRRPPGKPRKKAKPKKRQRKKYLRDWRKAGAWERAKNTAKQLRAEGHSVRAADIHKRRCRKCRKIKPASEMTYVPKSVSPDCRGGTCAACSATEDAQLPWAVRLARYRRIVAARMAKRAKEAAGA